MKKIFLAAAICFISSISYAQKDAARYKERSDELRQEIWVNPVAEFKVNSVPKELDVESAVIIARSFEIINSSKKKLKFSGFGVGAANRIFYRTVLHERVKINDKSALDQFSTIEYQKKLDNTSKFGFSKIYDKMDTYVGTKIIKPGGKEIVVNTDEEVLTKNSNKSQKSKLAISDLQVGDILDYYIIVEEMQESGAKMQGPYTFLMNGEYPVMYYHVRFQLDEKAGVKYIAANNAPAFKESQTEEGDNLLELKLKNLPKYESSTWTSPYRQYAYITLKYLLVVSLHEAGGTFRQGRIDKESLLDEHIKEYKTILLSPYYIDEYSTALWYESVGGRKNYKKVPQDSLLKVIYNGWRYETFCNFSTDKIDVSNDINYSTANSLKSSIYISRQLKMLKIPHDIVLVAARNSNSLKASLAITDMEAMIRAQVDNKYYWMAFDNITTNFNEIPARFQGEEAVTWHGEIETKYFLYNEGKLKIPVTAAVENMVAENMAVTFLPGNLQQLKIDRTCTLTGTYKSVEQKRLLLIENMEAVLAKAIGQKPFAERLKENKKTQKAVPEFAAAFSKEKSDWKNYFKGEIKAQFDEEPKEISAYGIKSDGLMTSAFIYNASFALDNFVKKAGNNFILDVGKLIGKYSKLEDKERKRRIDIYMYSARTFNYSINVAIPDGYTVKGVEDLAKNVSNETGTFVSSARIEGNSLKVDVSRSFTHNFETAASWPKLIDLLDAVYNFYNMKILLEKKK